jgi:hypothetical protein
MVLGANKGTVVSHLALDDDGKEFSGSTVNLLLVEPHLGLSDVRVQAALSAWLSGVNGCRFPRKSGVGIKPDVVTRGSRRTALILL